MAGETIETVITVDAKQAINELAKFDQETKAAEQALRDADAATKAFEKTQREAVAAVTAIDTRIAKYERDMMALGQAILSGTGNTKAYEVELRQLGKELDSLNGKTFTAKKNTQEFARAASQVERASQGSGLAVLEFSRAFEDAQYGVSGILNNIPSLLMNLGIGAGLTGVVSAAAVGVSMLAKNFGAIDPAAQEATNAAKDRVRSLRDEIRGLGSELRALQVGAERAAMEEQGAAVEAAARAAKAALAPVGGMERFRRLEDNQKLVGTVAAQMETARKAVEALDLELAKLAGMRRSQQEVEDQKRMELAIDNANEQTRREQDARDKARDKEKKDAEQAAKEDAEMHRKWVQQLSDDDDRLAKEADKRRKEEEKQRGQDLKNAFALYDAEFKAAEAAEKSRTKLAEREAKKRADIAEAERKAQIDSLTATATAAATAVGAFAAQSAMGQEAALSTLLSAAAQAAGGQIMLKGGEVIAGGIAGMLAAPNPASAAQIAGGLGLVAAGSAVQTGGPAAVSALLGMAGAGKSGSGAERSMGAADRGAAPRSSGGGGSGGPLVVNISYGVGGPLPEDTAREVARVMKTNDRRRGAA